MGQYVYRPHHGWRHGYRREKRKKWMIRIVKILFVGEGLILIMQYVSGHTYEKVYERELVWEDMAEPGTQMTNGAGGADTDGEVYGVGFEQEEGMFFLFRKRTEAESSMFAQPEHRTKE